jgi:hypothetical protein
VFLLLDGFGSHHTDGFLAQCEERQIQVMFLIPHSSDQTQPLDLMTFGLLKQRFAASKFDGLSSAQFNRIVRILGVWFAASAPHYNVEAFMNIGLIPFRDGDQFFFRVMREHARSVRRPLLATEAIPPVPLPREARHRERLPTGPA